MRHIHKLIYSRYIHITTTIYIHHHCAWCYETERKAVVCSTYMIRVGVMYISRGGKFSDASSWVVRMQMEEAWSVISFDQWTANQKLPHCRTWKFLKFNNFVLLTPPPPPPVLTLTPPCGLVLAWNCLNILL